MRLADGIRAVHAELDQYAKLSVKFNKLSLSGHCPGIRCIVSRYASSFTSKRQCNDLNLQDCPDIAVPKEELARFFPSLLDLFLRATTGFIPASVIKTMASHSRRVRPFGRPNCSSGSGGQARFRPRAVCPDQASGSRVTGLCRLRRGLDSL